MKLNETELLKLLEAEESERLEFKSQRPDNKSIGEYAVALGNEGGGWLLIGVTHRKPRQIVGISELSQPELHGLERSVFDSTSI